MPNRHIRTIVSDGAHDYRLAQWEAPRLHQTSNLLDNPGLLAFQRKAISSNGFLMNKAALS